MNLNPACLADQAGTTLGPATVIQVSGPRLKLELPDAHVWAVNAIAFPYQAAPGDEVLAIGQAGAWYVIGLLKGHGPSTLSVPGDLAIDAPNGRISLTAAQGVELRSDEVRVTANRLEVMARSVFERFTEATRWVKEAFQVRAGRLRTRIECDHDLRAGRIIERADADVSIDGTKINLG